MRPTQFMIPHVRNIVLVGDKAERPRQSVMVLLLILWAKLFLGISDVIPVATIARYTRVSTSGGNFIAGGWENFANS